MNYREKEEVDRWREMDPIDHIKKTLAEWGVLKDVSELEQRIEQEVQEAIEFAKSSPEPSVDQLMTDIYA